MITLVSNGHPLREISVKSLAAYLTAQNIPVRTIYLNCRRIVLPYLVKQVLELTKDSTLIGFSMMTKDFAILAPLVAAINKTQHIPLVFGGIHASAAPEECLAVSDFVCRGEGEEPLARLYRAVQGGHGDFEIPNIGYSKDGRAVLNPVSYFISDLDALPYPDYRLKNSHMFKKNGICAVPESDEERCAFFAGESGYYYYSQRGCKFACSYCSNSFYHGLAREAGARWFRTKSADTVIDELAVHAASMPFITSLTINDDDFLARDISEIEKIAPFIKNVLRMPFTINAIPSFVNSEKLKLLAQNGLSFIAFGVQSGSDRVLKSIYNRPISFDRVLASARMVHEEGIPADYGFILDNPYENVDDWKDTIRLLRALPQPRTISLYSLEFFPNTKLTNRAEIDGYLRGAVTGHNKDYRSDIAYSYKNTMAFLYSYFTVPDRLSNVLLSEFMIASPWAAPFRYLLAYPLGHLIRSRKKVAEANRDSNLVLTFARKIRRLVIGLMSHENGIKVK